MTERVMADADELARAVYAWSESGVRFEDVSAFNGLCREAGLLFFLLPEESR